MGDKFVIRQSDLEELLETEGRGYIIAKPKNSNIYVAFSVSAGNENCFFGGNETDLFASAYMLFNQSCIGIPYIHEEAISGKSLVESQAMKESSEGLFRYFCTIYEKELTIFTPVKEAGVGYPERCSLIVDAVDKEIENMLEYTKKNYFRQLSLQRSA